MSPLAKRIVEALAPPLAYWYIRFLGLTMRPQFRDRERQARARDSTGPYIMAFWHSRLVMMRFGYPDSRCVVLQSQHRDSRMLGRVMTRFGIGQVWGSTTRGGTKAVREVLRRIRDGYDVAIAPDGPRGPRRRAQAGVIAIARMSGKPILPMAYSAKPALRLRSWDRLLLPHPFSRVLYVYGEPISIDRRADAAEQERLRQALEDELNRLTDLVDTEVGLPLVDPAPLAESTDGFAPDGSAR